MTRLTLRSLRARRRRLVGTGLAVILGVAFLAATLVLGDTMRESFKGTFAEANAGTDLIVRNRTGIGGGGDELFQRGPTDEALVARIAEIPDVEDVAAEYTGAAQILGSDGSPLGGGGPPTIGTNWVDSPDINPYRIVDGRPPAAAGEVVIDAKSADDGDLAVGDRTTVKTPDVHTVTVVGIARFGAHDSLAGTTLAAFDDATAQALFAAPGEASDIRVHGRDGVTAERLRTQVSPVLDETSEALTGVELSAEQQADIEGDFLGFVETMLLAFAGVALIVATFSIYNTFTILVAQRSRESALLRALGASRRQVLTSITVEALVVGAVASAVGLGVGLALALGLKALLGTAGLELAVPGVVVSSTAVVASLIVGVVVTTFASVLPAVRASRVAPVAALREVALDPTAASRGRGIAGASILGAGAAMVVFAAVGSGSMAMMGLGALLTLIGAVVLGPVAAGPVAGALGWPATVLRGTTGRIARRNVVRNPRRTASSATALLVGVAVVTVFTIMAASIKTSIDETVERSFGGDLVVGSEFGDVGLSPRIGEQVAELPEVASSVALAEGIATFDGDDTFPAVADPARLASVLDLDVTGGSLEEMEPGQIAVAESYAEDHSLALGDTVDAAYADGATQQLTVGALYTVDDLVSDVIMTPADWAPHARTATDVVVLVDLADGVSLGEGESAVRAVVDRHHGPDVQTSDEFVDSVAAEVDQALMLVYGLLGLAVLIALMGIANTLSLAVHERTRELGLLRAVGQTRRQLRSTVRWESVVVALFGTLGGLGLGTFLGWGLVRSLAEEGFDAFTLPAGPVVTIVVLAAGAGVLAAIRPARRGARLDILDALAAD